MKHLLRIALVATICTGLLAGFAQGQDGGRYRGYGDRDRDGDRGDRGDRGRYGRRSFDPKDILRRMDDNGNGIIEPNEMSDRSRGFLERAATKAGLDMKQPLPIDKLGEAFDQLRAESDGGSSSGTSTSSSSSSSSTPMGTTGSSTSGSSGSNTESTSSSSTSSSSSSKETPKVPGFGVAADRPKPPGFDVPLGESDANIEQRFESRVIEYVERMLSEQDKNKDGYIDSEEWKAGRWSTPPESSDTNKDGRLSKLELCVRIANRYGSRDRDRDRDRNRDDDKNKSSSSSSSSGSSSDDKFRSYAEGLLKQHDKNKSGYLEKDEIAELKGNYRTADVNGDGVITVEELANKLKSYSTGSSSGSSTSSSRSSSSTSSNSGSTTPVVKRTPWWKKDTKEMAAEPVERKSYRFLSPTERLPKGLPDWFLRNDANADGQVMMVEYAATWTETAAAEFSKYDVDGDGFISPEECLAVEQLKKK